jgi:glycerophosphoryl diester phosphodiesterase
MPQDIHFYLELKAIKSPDSLEWNKKLVDKVISILKKEKIKQRCLLMSFNHDLIKYLKENHPSYSAGLVVKSEAILNAVLKEKEIKYNCLALEQKLFKDPNIKMAMKSGIPIIAWTVNDKKIWEKISSYGPLGIITDYPGKFSKL